MHQPTSPTRRGAMALLAAGVTVALLPRPAWAQLSAATQAAVDRIRGSRTPQEGRITLRAPPIAENGNTVPISVLVDSPMTPADHVRRIYVFADKNPTPDVATFTLTPALGRAQVDTRIRLGQTQDLVVLAEMSDGALYMARTEVKVTIGGCGG
ncbi:MAG: thiosulfate oxidation carrier protein SoxY [Rhodovarius sp.]|nr:thiosulfate oxidation carrier protein SoxY [Rhodovarius sp.]MCX7931811.1 thiosulfate oxidation carrier protein SoxY [Rhodovarius sp.]MDW8314340.1 thiosulfate oxidation carrier protein SoxY [Rhodovarius sp.]